MTEDRVKRKDLWKQLCNIKRQKVWLNAAEKLGFIIDTSTGGTSHTNIRDKRYPITDVRSLVVTVQSNLYKVVNEKYFKRFLDFGIEEDAIWRALGMLK